MRYFASVPGVDSVALRIPMRGYELLIKPSRLGEGRVTNPYAGYGLVVKPVA